MVRLLLVERHAVRIARLLSAAASLDGAWQLQGYVLDGEDVPVSGTLIFSGDHFAMVYRMGASAGSGRGHGGTYRVEEDRILFSIPYWLQYVDGASRVMTETSEAGSRFEIEGDELRIRFENDAVQRFREGSVVEGPARRRVDDDPATRARPRLETRRASRSSKRGASFSSTPWRKAPRRPTRGRTPAHTESKVTTLTLKVESSIHCVGGAGRVERTPSPRDVSFRLAEGKLDLEFGSGARMSFLRTRS